MAFRRWTVAGLREFGIDIGVAVPPRRCGGIYGIYNSVRFYSETQAGRDFFLIKMYKNGCEHTI